MNVGELKDINKDLPDHLDVSKKCNAPLCNEGVWCAMMPCKGVQEAEKKDLKITMQELVALSLLLEKYKEVIGDDNNHHRIDRVMVRNGYGRSDG